MSRTAKKTVAVLYSGGRQWGGIETYLLNLFRLNPGDSIDLVLISLGEWELTRALGGLSGKGGRSSGSTGRSGGASQAGIARCRLLPGQRARLRTVWDLRRVLRQESARLLVSQGVVANAYARLAARAAGIPHLVVVHSDLANDYVNPLVRFCYRTIDRWLRPLTDRYVTVAGFLGERLVAAGVPAEKVRVIYNGVAQPRQQLTTGPDARRAEAGKSVVLCTVGRLHPVKNLDALIEAMTLLPAHVCLDVWGEGPEEELLRNLITALGVEGRVRLRGAVASVADALAQADVYVQASKSEGCPYAVLEAMAAGKPVVVTPCGGMPELVRDGETGVVAEGTGPHELAAAIRRVSDDWRMAAELARAGQEAVRRDFGLDRWLAQTLTAFDEVAR